MQLLILPIFIASFGASSLALAGHFISNNESLPIIPSGEAAKNGIFLSTNKPQGRIFFFYLGF